MESLAITSAPRCGAEQSSTATLTAVPLRVAEQLVDLLVLFFRLAGSRFRSEMGALKLMDRFRSFHDLETWLLRVSLTNSKWSPGQSKLNLETLYMSIEKF